MYYIFPLLQFLIIFAKLCTCKMFQNHKIAKLNTHEIKHLLGFRFSFSPNIWLKYDIDTRLVQISTYSNKIRVAITYFIKTNYLVTEKLIFNETFLSYFFWNREIK